MRTSEEIELNTSQGRFVFTVRQLGGIAAGRVLVRVGPHIPKLFAAVAGLDLRSLATPDGLRKFDLSKLDFAAIGSALAEVTPDDFERVTLELLGGSFAIGTDDKTGEKTKIDLGKAALDQLFIGRVWDLFKLIGFSIRVNYSGFFDDLSANGPRPKAI